MMDKYYDQVLLVRREQCQTVYVEKGNVLTHYEGVLLEKVFMRVEDGILMLNGQQVIREFSSSFSDDKWDLSCEVEKLPPSYVYDENDVFTRNIWSWSKLRWEEKRFLQGYVRVGFKDRAYTIKNWEIII